MKRIFLITGILLSMFIACKKDYKFMAEGTITGPDFRECMCCGGYFIVIKSNTYRFYGLPGNSGIDLTNEKFPVYVELDWKKVDPGCLGDEITVEKIKKK